ncbi:ABC transporter permease subunit [Brachybacterium sp. GPGPB12]|uniref:ABC transporter permease subunit n=1 Tax=Brachybacterium sp. GPGPB12 TaxID=3023517 RepID=UPI0031342FF0
MSSRPPRSAPTRPAATAGISRRRSLGAGALAAAAVPLAGRSTPLGAGLLGTELNPDTLVYWNLFGGGDGVRMQDMQQGYRDRFGPGSLQATTLTWGNPYYSKLTLATVGNQPPDVAVAHLTRAKPLWSGGSLDAITEEDLAGVGLSSADFNAQAWDTQRTDGQNIAIPLDTHPFTLFYHREVCEQAGLLDGDGLLVDLTGLDRFEEAPQEISAVTGGTAITVANVAETATPWRFFWTLYNQLEGATPFLSDDGATISVDESLFLEVTGTIQRWVEQGWLNSALDYATSQTQMFTGNAGFYLQGEWEIATAQSIEGLDFGMAPIPRLFDVPAVQADSHTFILPRKERSPEQPPAGDGVHQDDARAEPGLGRRRAHPRLPAHRGERGVPRPGAPAVLLGRRGLRGLRRPRLVRRLRLDLRGHRRGTAGARPAGCAHPRAGTGRDPEPARDLHLDPQPALTRKAQLMTTMSPTAPPAGRAQGTRSRPGGAVTRRTPQAWLFLAPFAVTYLAFMVGPMVWMFVASFFNTSTVRPGLGSFAGLDNYLEMFGRDDFWSSLWHTLQFTLYTVPPLVVLSFVLAVLTNRMKHGQWFFRLAFFLPFILPSATIALIWVFIFTPSSGLWSLPASLVGMDPGAGILSSPNTAMIGIAIATVWWTIGFNFVLYLAGLQEIPRELYEAAAVDGASPWRRDPPRHHPAAEPDHGPGDPAADHRKPEDLRPGVPDDQRRSGHLDAGLPRPHHEHGVHGQPGRRGIGRVGSAVPHHRGDRRPPADRQPHRLHA